MFLWNLNDLEKGSKNAVALTNDEKSIQEYLFRQNMDRYLYVVVFCCLEDFLGLNFYWFIEKRKEKHDDPLNLNSSPVSDVLL
ncbi:CLUMA_CG019718, isoform A [Clunio marinus]|uniref:CLUMA_CG019718, isoform A n=1 Tax=Clunio marinus TaxID=568069 RepID=A0A1J1J7F0_9DIPT|nr:CLUMA_CG019718, isoform A [Clunio marinus]